ncbi:MAG: hypothetical protein ACTH7Q_11830 [Pseudoalteromonas sp.]
MPEVIVPEPSTEELKEQARAAEAEATSTATFASLIVGGNITVLLLGWLAIRELVQIK